MHPTETNKIFNNFLFKFIYYKQCTCLTGTCIPLIPCKPIYL